MRRAELRLRDPRRALVITLMDMGNFGNRLQNYAVHAILARHAIVARTIFVAPRGWSLGQTASKVFPLHPQRAEVFTRGGFVKWYRFFRFTKTHTPIKRYSRRLVRRLAGSDDRTIIAVGSDQIWNPNFWDDVQQAELRSGFLLAPSRAMTIAPSFGVSQLPDASAALFTRWLPRLGRVSVREQSGAELVRVLTGCQAVVLPDPTLGLTAAQWRHLARGRKVPSGQYILLYYLGLPGQTRELVERYAAANQLSVVDLMSATSQWRKSGPADFVALIDNATLVVTDSFHAAVFSLILHTPFAITRRHGALSDMFSRIETLTQRFGCEDRVLAQETPLLPETDIDWTSVDVELGRARQQLDEWVKAELDRLGDQAS